MGALDRDLKPTKEADPSPLTGRSDGVLGTRPNREAGGPALGRRAGVLRPRRGLPSSRAVVGGLLVAVALVGTWWSASGAGAGSGERYLVVSHAVGPGERLDRSDLGWVAANLPDRLRSRAYTDPASLLGQVTTAPLQTGDLVQSSSVVRSPGGPGERELSFVVDTDWAVGGTLRAGDRIDLLVTYGDGVTSETRTVLADTTVRRVSAPGGDSLGSTRTQSITVAIDDSERVRAATNAARAGTITVVRSTGVIGVSSNSDGTTGDEQRVPQRSGRSTTSTTQTGASSTTATTVAPTAAPPVTFPPVAFPPAPVAPAAPFGP